MRVMYIFFKYVLRLRDQFHPGKKITRTAHNLLWQAWQFAADFRFSQELSLAI